MVTIAPFECEQHRVFLVLEQPRLFPGVSAPLELAVGFTPMAYALDIVLTNWH